MCFALGVLLHFYHFHQAFPVVNLVIYQYLDKGKPIMVT
ncbi:hypothetical protein JCM19233_7501 [Vibrio astriarenae]|nr:hypothetical protein JCM19233_7501 [Vibrio sp. C7]